MIRLETQKRYYLINLSKDLFDQWCVFCIWGSKFTKLGNRKIYLTESESSGQRLIEKIIKVRLRHGYYVIEN